MEFFQETGRTPLAHTLLNSSSKASRLGCGSCARISEVMVSSPGLVFFLHLDKAIRNAVMLKGSLKYWSSAGSCPPWSSSECSSSKADLRSWNSTECPLLLLTPEKYFPKSSAFSLLVV